MSTFNIPQIGVQYDWSHNLVVAKSGGDFTSIKEAVDAIENASQRIHLRNDAKHCLVSCAQSDANSRHAEV
jgi:hypothetical protein